MAQQTSYPCENCKFRTIGYAKDIPRKWAAFYFFFQP